MSDVGIRGAEDRGRLGQILFRMGFSKAGLILITLVAVLPLIPPFNNEFILRWLVVGAFLAAQAVAFDLTAGFINVVNFGFAAILGVGAYTSAILTNTTPHIIVKTGISPWVGIFIGGFAAAFVGFILGFLTLRLRGLFAAIMSWFVGIALLGLARTLTPLTRGSLGMNPVSLLDTTSNRPYFYVILIMMAVIYIVTKLVTTSNIGLAFRALGQNFDAARASGINPTLYRVFNFTLSCFFAGLLGGFYAHYFVSMTPNAIMHTSKAIEILAIAYIGGRGFLWGGMLVAFPFVFFIEYLRSSLPGLPGLHIVIYGVVMILVMIFYPNGLAGFLVWLRERVRGLVADRKENEGSSNSVS
jgi:branched-chain amino acid transport system permease protein